MTLPGQVLMQDAEIADTEVLLESPKRFVREVLVLPDGSKLDWCYVDTPASVLVVPVLASGHLVMVSQYRHNLRRYTLEFPAGILGDGEDPTAAAARELGEETGYALAEGASMQSLGAFNSLPSETNRRAHMFLARPVVKVGPATRDNEIERYFNMDTILITPGLLVAEIGKKVVGTETISAFYLAQGAA